MERTIFLGLILTAALIGGADSIRVLSLDPAAKHRRDTQKLDEDVLHSPGPEVMKLVALEHAEALADILWLQIVQELGKPAEGERASYDRLQRWANIAVDLDQKYYTVYWASALNLIAYARRATSAERLLKKGMKALPDRYEFPFLIGYVYYFLRGDSTSGATWWDTASRVPGAPAFLPSLVGRVRAVAGDRQGAIELLESLLDELPPMQRDEAEIRLKILKSEPALQEYDEACKKFREERGRLPADGNELYAEKYTRASPYDLLESPIIFKGEDCRARTAYITVRDDEMAKETLGKEGVSPDDDREDQEK